MVLWLAKGCRNWILLTLMFAVIYLILFFLIDGKIRFVFLISMFLSLLGLVAFMVFFRDPERSIGDGIVAPADGVIQSIEVKGEYTIISTFMEVTDVHVNRIPIAGTIVKRKRYRGTMLRANRDGSELNERYIYTISTDIGIIKVAQISGLIARKIVPYANEGDFLSKGSKLGMICLGSRVDVYLPTSAVEGLRVGVGDSVKAGSDTIAVVI